jgi:protein-tyrosine phosphatase
MKILMVCLGNICRSPLAEGILQHKARQAGLQWKVESAGTGTWHIGQPPHHLSQKVSKMNSIDIGEQRCRQFRKEDMLHFDFIYVMDENNYEDVKTMSGELWNKNKAGLLLNELYPGENRGVPDPYNGKESDYHEVFRLIEKACGAIIEKASPNPACPAGRPSKGGAVQAPLNLKRV